MLYNDDRTGKTYLLNLIDTPGHVDFSYEVIRSLASCQGALLLVDSSQSVQAQTLANHGNAKALGLALIPVVTKIDLPSAQPEETALNMSTTFDFDPDDCIMTSAREKIGIGEWRSSSVAILSSMLCLMKLSWARRNIASHCGQAPATHRRLQSGRAQPQGAHRRQLVSSYNHH